MKNLNKISIGVALGYILLMSALFAVIMCTWNFVFAIVFSLPTINFAQSALVWLCYYLVTYTGGKND